MNKELGFSDYIYHLWTRRIFILGFCFITLVLAYLGMRFLHGETFETKALMLVRDQPRLSAVEADETGIQPPAFQSLFTSDETIHFVRNQYNDMFERGALPPDVLHKRLETPLEKLRPRFRVENVTTVDTTITTKFSPVLEFSVLGDTRGQAHLLMELWTSYCLREFGNLINEEAEVAIQAYQAKNEELGEQLSVVLKDLEEIRQEKNLVDTKIAREYRKLTKMPPSEAQLYVTDDIMPFNMDAGLKTNVQISADALSDEDGIWEQMALLQKEINELGNDSDESGPLLVKIKMLAKEAQLIEEQLWHLRRQSAHLAGAMAKIEVQMNAVQYAIRLNSSAYAQAHALRRPPAETFNDPERDLAGNQESFGTLRLMTGPVVPDQKFAPPRSLIAIIVTIATGMFLIVVFSLERFMRHVIDLQRKN